MKRVFRVTIEADGKAPAEEFLNTLRKMSDRVKVEHGISVDVERVESTQLEDASFSTGDEYGD
jgi:hypothetical protein